jgi:transposase
MINRLRWHLHRLDPDLEHTARRLPGPSLGRIAAWLAEVPASAQIDICQELTAKIQTLTSASTSSVVTFAPGSRNWPPICSACPAVEC